MIRTPSASTRHGRSRSAGLTRRRRGGAAGPSSWFRDKHIIAYRLAWALVVLYAEVWIFQRSVRNCSWPTDFGFELLRTGSKPFKLLLIADPQILDTRSLADHTFVSRYWSIWKSDNYARKAWRILLKAQKPDAVFFLGDLLDSGVEVTDRDEHSHYVHRFQNIFAPIPRSLPMHYIPGNHDLGLHLTPGGSAYARERFTETFGPLNGQITLGNHSIIWIDAPGLLEERSLAAEKFETQSFDATNGGVVDFLRRLAQSPPALPKILFSHIPLYRTEGTPCGPLREARRTIFQDRGKNFQTELDHTASAFLLTAADPIAVFSGNDHDYCEVTHHLAMSSPKEVSCKTYSTAIGIRQPGYQLVTLLNPLGAATSHSTIKSATYQTKLCLLPDPTSIWYHIYISLLLLTLLLLAGPRFWLNIRTRQGTTARSNGLSMRTSSISRSILRRSAVKPADEEDEDGSAILSENEASDNDTSFIDHDSYTSGYVSPLHSTYAYHSPTDEDYMIATPREVVPRQGAGRVRRVSRVWLWDPQTNDEGYMRFLKRLGPIYRYLIRPSERIVRRGFHKVYGRRLRLLTAKLNSGNILGETLQDVLRISWAAAVMYLIVWAWYAW